MIGWIGNVLRNRISLSHHVRLVWWSRWFCSIDSYRSLFLPSSGEQTSRYLHSSRENSRRLSSKVCNKTEIVSKSSEMLYFIPYQVHRSGYTHGLTGSAVGHIAIAPGFKPWLSYARRVFHLPLQLISFGGCSAHLSYMVHRSSHKTTTFRFSTRCTHHLYSIICSKL